MKKKIIFISAFLLVLIGIVLIRTTDVNLIGSRTQSDIQIGTSINNVTANSILFGDSNKQVAQDNTNLAFNDSSNLFSFNKASGSTNFEVQGYASATSGFVTKSLVIGSNVASSSTYTAEFGGADAGSVSLLFGGNSSGTKGTCLQLKNTAGTWVYLRIIASDNSLLVTTTPCN